MEVRIVGIGGDEPPPMNGEAARDYVRRLALQKARYALKSAANAIVLGADTTVSLRGEIMGKPTNADDAVRMLKALCGKPHKVITGVAVIDAASGEWATTARSSDVHMRRYSDAEIAAYVATGEPYDKAGAYAAQDETFSPAERIEGCYLNVIGLPLCDVLLLLERIGARAALKPEWEIPDGCPDCARWAVDGRHSRYPNVIEQVGKA